MANFLILHGTGGAPDSNWFMWLKGVLIGQGHRVWLPQLPGSATPNANIYNTFLLSNPDFVFDAETIIVGHSSGAVAALNLLQQLPGTTKIKAAVLVSAFKDDLGWESLKDLFIEPFDFDAIKAHCAKFIYIHSDDDPHCPIEHPKFLVDKTGGQLIVYEGQGHFNTEQSHHYKQFPELLDLIESAALA